MRVCNEIQLKCCKLNLKDGQLQIAVYFSIRLGDVVFVFKSKCNFLLSELKKRLICYKTEYFWLTIICDIFLNNLALFCPSKVFLWPSEQGTIQLLALSKLIEKPNLHKATDYEFHNVSYFIFIVTYQRMLQIVKYSS